MSSGSQEVSSREQNAKAVTNAVGKVVADAEADLKTCVCTIHEYADKADIPNARVTGLVSRIGQARGLLLEAIRELEANGLPTE